MSRFQVSPYKLIISMCARCVQRASFVLPTTDALLPSDSSSSTPIRLSCCSAGHVASLAHTGTTSSMSDTAVGVSTALVFVNAMASQPRAPPSISPISHAIGGALSLLMRRAASYWLRAARPEEDLASWPPSVARITLAPSGCPYVDGRSLPPPVSRAVESVSGRNTLPLARGTP